MTLHSLYECLRSSSKYGYDIEYFWISGVALVLVGFFGLIGNLFNLAVLFRPKFRNIVFYDLLITLALFDILFILSYGIDIGYQAMACRKDYIYNISHILYPWLNMGLSGSTFTTVMVSIERYLGMCHPHLKYGRKTWVYVLLIFIIAISYNLPRFLEYQYDIVNGTLVSTPSPWIDDTYKERYHYLTPIFMEDAIPVTLLLVLNSAIIRMMYFSPHTVGDVVRKSIRNRGTATKTLLVVAAVFLLSKLPCITCKLLYYLGSEEDDFRSKWYFMMPVKKLILMVNSSINFIIYCMVGTKFQKEFLCLLKCKVVSSTNWFSRY